MLIIWNPKSGVLKIYKMYLLSVSYWTSRREGSVAAVAITRTKRHAGNSLTLFLPVVHPVTDEETEAGDITLQHRKPDLFLQIPHERMELVICHVFSCGFQQNNGASEIRSRSNPTVPIHDHHRHRQHEH